MLLGCVAIGISGEALELNPFISWGLAGVLLVGAIYWCFKLEKKHREKHPKHPKQPKQAWEKAQRKRTAVVTTLILGITAILMIAGKGGFAFGFLALSVGACVLYLWAYELVEPYAKDRKSAIRLAITIIFVVITVACACRQMERPAIENRPNPGINR